MRNHRLATSHRHGPPRRARGILAAAAALLVGMLASRAAAEAASPAADPVVAEIVARVKTRATMASVHDELPAIERALAAAGVAPEAFSRLVADVHQADLPGMAASLDVFLFLTRVPEWRGLRQHFAEFLELPGVAELDAHRVRPFAEYDGLVTLPDVTVLTPQSAAALTAFGENGWGAGIEFPSVGELAPDAAAALSKCMALLVFPQLDTLSADTASALAAHEGIGIALGGIDSLPAEVAAALATTKSMQGLMLPDLEVLDSQPLARRLARQDHVFLPRITSLQPAVAQALRGNEGGELALPGLTELPADVARELVGGGYYWLTLGAAEKLSPETATILARHPGQLTFTGPFSFSAAAARRLAAHEGLISLPHIAELPVGVAEALAEHEGSLLLGGVTTLTVESARPLAAHPGAVHLPAIQTLTPEVAAVIAPHLDTIVLAGVRTLDVATATALVAHGTEALTLGGLTDLSPEVAVALAAFDGTLALPAVTSLTPEVARAIAAHRGPLALQSITELPANIAVELAKHSGALDLHGLQSLSTKAARALAAAPGRLSLPSLTSLTPEAATALLQRDDHLSLDAIRSVDRIDSLPVAELIVAEFDDLELANLTSLDGPQAAAIAGVLARTRGTLSLPVLDRITPRALELLLAKEGVSIPDTEGLTLVREPGVGFTDDVVIPNR